MSSTEQTLKYKRCFLSFQVALIILMYCSNAHYFIRSILLLLAWNMMIYRWTLLIIVDAGLWAQTIDCSPTARSILCRLWFHMHKIVALIPWIFYYLLNLCTLQGSFASLFTFFQLLIKCLCALQFLWTLQYGCDG